VRVKLSYGVQIEDVPKELATLFDYVYEKKIKLENQIDFAEKLIEENEFESAFEIMEKIRGTLLMMDSRVADCSLIAQGMINIKKQEEQKNQQTEQVYTEPEGERDVSERGPFVDSTEHITD
tara:strand:- start:4165 stop:4530 length:366 start_codon:yes stop_codon:yes gene_type:complete